MKLLIVSERIAPYQCIASIRWSKIIKYLKLHYQIEQIDVITLDVKNGYGQIRDDALLNKDLKYIDHYYAIPLPLFSQLYSNLVSNIKKQNKQYTKINQAPKTTRKIRRKLRSFLLPLKQREITASILRYINHNIDMNQYQVIITSYGPEWTHRVGQKLREKFKNIFWIADFRDQWNREFKKLKQTKVQRKAKRICSKADCLLRVNPHLELFEKPGQKIITLPNGFDPEEKVAPEKPDRFRIIYTGTIYSSDNLDAIFRVLRQLIRSNKMDCSDLTIEYAGSTKNPFVSYIQKYQLESNFINHGYLTRTESLKLQSQSALLLMAGWSTKTEEIVWSGKMYEYMMAQKPIIYLMAGEEKECEAARSMELLGGVCYQTCRHQETYPILTQYILEKYQEWKATGDVSIKRNNKYIEQFSYPRITETFNQILKEIQQKTDKSS